MNFNSLNIFQFFSILLVVLVGMVSAAVLGYIKRGDVEKVVEKGITAGMQKYGQPNETAWTDQIDFMQSEVNSQTNSERWHWFSSTDKKILCDHEIMSGHMCHK